ncbi:MAG: family 16 glycosylhydrolase [Verrucomicrobiae bacterium]|nr:family 16 glycosylhydrolase [Verrucomicrobiae bacterium]
MRFFFRGLFAAVVWIAVVGPRAPMEAADQAPRAFSGWRLIWADEFDHPRLDFSKWKPENADLRKNQEQQYYSPDEIYIRNGCLELHSESRNLAGRSYVSGLVDTHARFARTYGRVEIRAKLPRGQGIWPAHWMLPESRGWPPELDIMEMRGDQPKKIYMTLHSGSGGDHRMNGFQYVGEDYSQDFHVFTVEWEPTQLGWYIDGKRRYFLKRDLPSEPMFLVLNTAVGGDWAGMPDSTTPLPQIHSIDYVRYYAREKPGFALLNAGGPDGAVEAEPNLEEYPLNTRVRLKAVARPGFRFTGWTGDLNGLANPIDVMMDRSKEIRARFEDDPEFRAACARSLGYRKPATASSELVPAFAIGSVNDGDPLSLWYSAESTQQWLSLDLQKSCTIRKVSVAWGPSYGTDYRLELSDDQKTWRPLAKKSNGTGGLDVFENLQGSGRYLRLATDNAEGHAGVCVAELIVEGQ